MVIAPRQTPLNPTNGPDPRAESLGFRFGEKGTHTSRTIMFDEISALLAATSPSATRKEYAAAIIELNCLAKPTAASRRSTSQRLGELYALDPGVSLFRVLRRLWDLDRQGQRLLAMLCAIARDPLLAATVPTVMALQPGADLLRDPLIDSLREIVGDRMNDSILAKVGRNAASSWTQSGHLEGRTFKKRRSVTPTPLSVAFALYLGHAVGFRGTDLIASGWMTILDCTPPKARELALEAKRIGLVDLRMAGDVIELRLDRLDPANPGS